MKKYLSILLFILLFVSCTMKQRNNKMVLYSNYSIPEKFIIETDCPYLTDNQFNQAVLDTSQMYKYDRNTNMLLTKAIYRVWYEQALSENNDRMAALFATTDSTDNDMVFFLYGKLNLQSNINSLVILETYTKQYWDSYQGILWLFNIKDNHLYSIVNLDFLANLTSYPRRGYLSTNIKNKILTNTSTNTEYFLLSNIGMRDWNSYESEMFAQYVVNEDGYIEFVKK